MHPEDKKHRDAGQDVECGNGGAVPLIFAILLGILFVFLAVVAALALLRGPRDVRTPAFTPPDFGAAAGQFPTGILLALLVFFGLLLLVMLLLCCCGCKKGGGLGAFGLLLAPLVCPIITALNAAADALDAARDLTKGLNEVSGLSAVLDDAGKKLQAAAGQVGSLQIPSISVPETDNLFSWVAPPDLNPPTRRVLTGDITHNANAQPDAIRVARDELNNAGGNLITAGEKLASLGDQLHAAAEAFRSIARLLAFFVPCDEWERIIATTRDTLPSHIAK